MSYKLFIDDERLPISDDWVIVRSSADAIQYVKNNGWPNEISFDHDLGKDDTSIVFIKWMIDQLLDINSTLPFVWYVHSQNPVGANNINSLLLSFQKAMQ